jgi:hypothetical protein
MSEPNPFDDLQLNSIVYEAVPWDGKVYRRYVKRVDTFAEVMFEGSSVQTVRALYVNGGMFGTGEKMTKAEWGVRFFTDLDLARRVCAERSLALKAERRQQIESEMAALAKQLEQE